MWNEELRSNSMKGSGPEVSNYELPGDGAANTLATPFSVTPNLFGLTGLCDQITSISSTDLSTSSKDQPLKSPGSYHNNCPNPVLSNSHLGSALHSSVARSFSDSTKHDRLRNAYPFAEPSTFSSSRGWPVDHNARAGGTGWQGSFNSLYVSKSHNEVSRSQSDHVSSNSEQSFLQVLKMPTGYPNDYESLQNLYKSKVIFALKLGYSEAMLQSALRKVGLHSGENQLLEELIALQKMKPQALEVSEPLAGKLPPEERGSSFSIRSDSGVDVSEKESDLLPIVIDGSNVAMSHGNKERFSCKGIRICVDWFLQRGHRDITVFVPMWRKESPKADNPISEQHILGELQKENLLAFTPSRQVSGRRYVCHDDRYILNLASETGAIVVSNDNYRDLVNDKPDYKKVIEEKVLMYTFVNDRFMPPDDPLGRGGPSLEVFLRKPKPAVVTQLCPYEKKCTYGYKCKFYHPERISQPQKSISDTLKENSNRKIYEVRSRSPTSGDVMGDPLSRTQSMQPNETRFPMKKALSRTKSLNPNLERAMMQTHLQSQTLWTQQFEQERAGIVMHRQHTITPEAMPSIHQTIIDTSVPPPPCLSWQRFDPSDLMGLHPKLERQLTLNPVGDPRIHVTSVSREPTMHDTFAYPPPVIANLRQLHSPVKRNSSAPEVNTATGPMSRSPVPTLVHMDSDLSTVPINTQMAINCSPIHYRQPVGPGVIGDRLMPHHPFGDLQLCKSKSE